MRTLAFILLLACLLFQIGFASERVVYPQAAVGPTGDQWFEIELRLGNRDPNFPWQGAVRLLKQGDLSGMTDLQVTGSAGAIATENGGWEVDLEPNGSSIFRVRSNRLQVGILTIEGLSDTVDVVPSFFYRLRDGSDDSISDLIAIHPVRQPGLAYDTMISKTATFDVGLAMVADRAIGEAGGAIPETQVTLSVITETGDEFQEVTTLGGTESAQKAVFPHQLIPALPASLESARLHLAASDPVYVTLLGVGTPPLFQDIQIGAAPAQLAAFTAFPLREGWGFVTGGEDLIQGNLWECAGTRITEFPGGMITTAGTGWEAVTNRQGAFLEVDGDFGLLTTLDSPDGAGGYLTTVGRPASGPESWRGLRRLDFGVADGDVRVQTWNGSPTPGSYTFPAAAPLIGQVRLELAREANQFAIYANGERVGTLPDWGLTQDDRIFLGSNIPPQSSLTVFGLSAAAPKTSLQSVRVVRPLSSAEVPVRENSLRALAASRGLRIGAAADPSRIPQEAGYRNTLGGEFNMLTAENVMKWGPIHPERDRYDFCPADTLVAFAEANSMAVRGHVLVWHQQNPNWLTQGNFEREEMIGILREHIFTVVGRYRGRISEWDVLNEAIDDSGNLRDTVWLRSIGPDYIDMAFRWARQADPQARLFYNDYSAEAVNSKSTAIYNLVQGMLDRGVPVDGVGFQAHIGAESGLRPSKTSVLENLQRFGALGLETIFTELDVRIRTPVTQSKLEQQAEVYREMLEACIESGSCGSFVTWGVTDKYSWIPNFFAGFDAALLFDSSYQPKPAYDALVAVLSTPEP